MTLTITIHMDNAAFQDDPSIEAARILRELAQRLDGHPHFSEGHSQALHDANGNEVGNAVVRWRPRNCGRRNTR
ncbi:MAG: hypothetical protein AAB502_07120 [Chloroflexota bacterium]